MNYRVYQNVSGWEYVTTASKEGLHGVLNSLPKETYILVIQHDISLDMDEPFYHGCVGDYEERQKILTKREKRGRI